MGIKQEIQQPETSELIELFSLDLTKLGGSVYYFTPNVYGSGASVVWQGYTYIPFDLQASGFELDGRGSAPQPKITFSLTNSVITGYIAAFQDLIGAKVTRTKTYKKYLDGEASANTSAHYPLDIYRIERKVSENRLQVEFELSSVMDQRGTQLPGRIINSFYCPWRYRLHNGGTSGNPLLDFTYHPADNKCPYVGSTYFNENNTSCAASADKCSHTENGCKARFGATGELPFGAFPGASRPVLS